MNNFAVLANKKYAFSSKKRKEKEEINLIIQNIGQHKTKKDIPFLLTAESLPFIKTAILEVKGWHTGKFTPAVLNKSPHIFNFVRPSVISAAAKMLGTDDFKKILIIPTLSNSKQTRENSISIMKDKGVDHLIEFKTILSFIIENIKTNKNYIESDILQTIRLLKHYSLIKDKQLELFLKK